MSVQTYTKAGNKATTAAKLDKSVFGIVPENHDLLKQAYVAYMANGRENLASVKTRAEVRGGGRKPWRQKGTGRARFGSTRNPIWRGGGITFGPSGMENYSKKLNLGAKRLALKQALSLKAENGAIKIVEEFGTKERKVKPIITLLDKIGAEGNILLVGTEKNEFVEYSTRNIPNVAAKQAMYLNVYEVLNADTIVISKEALDIIGGWLGGKK